MAALRLKQARIEAGGLKKAKTPRGAGGVYNTTSPSVYVQ